MKEIQLPRQKPAPPHATLKSYRKGCRCEGCRAENARYQRNYQAMKKEARQGVAP